MLAVTELFNIAVNDFDAMKSVHYSRVLVVTAFLVSGIQFLGIRHTEPAIPSQLERRSLYPICDDRTVI